MMRIDPFVAGLPGVGLENGLTEGDKDTLIDAAESFLRAGGNITWDFWRSLEPESRAAFVAASERLRSEIIGSIGLACIDKLCAARFLAEVDGGETEIRIALDRAVTGAIGSLQDKRVDLK